MKKVYISRNYKDVNSAGGKAKTDIETAIQQVGYRNIGMPQKRSSGKVYDFFYNLLGATLAALRMPRKGVLLLQYPTKKYYSFYCRMAHLRGTKVITVIHDLGSFRRKKLTAEKEIRRLSHTDYIVAHTPAMRQWLLDQGYKGKVGVLGIFDYFSATRNHKGAGRGKDGAYSVIYAGGLARRKNMFIYDLAPRAEAFDFVLFGNGFQPDELQAPAPRLECRGFVLSDDLIASVDADFGLVWDGDSIDTCSGDFGVYLRHNAPHKVSLYLRSHLPVVIWKEAAMAPFVVDNGLGIAVSSLADLDSTLVAVTPEQYDAMRRNTLDASEKLASGHFVQTAVAQAEKELFC